MEKTQVSFLLLFGYKPEWFSHGRTLWFSWEMPKLLPQFFTSAGGMQNSHPFLLQIWWEVEGFWCRKYNCRTCDSYPIWLANDVSQNNGGASFKPMKFFSIINHTFDHFGTVCNNSVHQLSLFLLVIDISCCWVTTKDFHSQFLWIGRVSHNCFHYCSKVCVRTLLM